jgi:hypothetical protein
VEDTRQDVFGTIRVIKCRAYYVPDATVCLFSPQTAFQRWQKGSLFMDEEKTQLTLHCGTTLEFPYNNGSNLPLMLTPRHFKRQDPFVGLTYQDAQTLSNLSGLSALLNVADETNQNLTAAQKELLLWHHKLGNADMQRVQTLLAKPVLATNPQLLVPMEAKASSCKRPL